MFRWSRVVLAIGLLCLIVLRPAVADTYRSGTGFVVHSSGLVLTCRHVVQDAEKIEVFFGERRCVATIQGMDALHDLALLRLDQPGPYPALPLASAGAARLGEEVRAFGFPLTATLGTSLKVTRGSVSGIETEEDERILQIDTPVNPGNSGGPLVNEHGLVVGVVTSRFTEATVFGFSVPVDTAAPLLVPFAPDVPAPMAAASALEGPELVRRVAPSVAFIRVTPRTPVPEKPAELPVAVEAKGITVPASIVQPASSPSGAAKPASPQPPAGQPTPKAADNVIATPPNPGTPAPGTGPTWPAAPATEKPETAKQPTADTVPARPAVNAATLPESVKPMATVVPAPETVNPAVGSPAVAVPAKPAATTAIAPETTKPSVGTPAAPEVAKPAPPSEADVVDRELAKIRQGDPLDLPLPQADEGGSGTAEEPAEWQVTNLTRAPLVVFLRGPEKRAVTIAPGKAQHIVLKPGVYEIGGRLETANISPFYATQPFRAGYRYRSRFRVEIK
jgi:hypothetical protein